MLRFQPVTHGAIIMSNVMVDGETHRGKLLAREIMERIEQIVAIRDNAFTPITES
jgi:hypothetical protein